VRTVTMVKKEEKPQKTLFSYFSKPGRGRRYVLQFCSIFISSYRRIVSALLLQATHDPRHCLQCQCYSTRCCVPARRCCWCCAPAPAAAAAAAAAAARRRRWEVRRMSCEGGFTPRGHLDLSFVYNPFPLTAPPTALLQLLLTLSPLRLQRRRRCTTTR